MKVKWKELSTVLILVLPVFMIPYLGMLQGTDFMSVLIAGSVVTFVVLLYGSEKSLLFYDAINYATGKVLSAEDVYYASRFIAAFCYESIVATIALLIHGYCVETTETAIAYIPIGYGCLILSVVMVYALLKGYIAKSFWIKAAIVLVIIQCSYIVYLTWSLY